MPAVTIHGYRLYKSEKLCSHTAVEQLFAHGHSLFSHPLRARYAFSGAPRPGGAEAQFMITVPKRKVRHAVGRSTLRRRVREAYRLCRQDTLLTPLRRCGLAVDIAFIYIADTDLPFGRIDSAMRDLLCRVAAHAEREAAASSPPSPPDES